LAAAITVAEKGCAVLVLEGAETIGGGTRTDALTLPGFVHDVCSAVHPLGVSSPFFRSLPLEKYGLRWIDPPVALAHPLDDGTAAVLLRSVEQTADSLGADAENYRKFMGPFAKHADDLIAEALRPSLRLPRHPILLARFGLAALQSAEGLAERKFQTPKARALLAGMAGHSTMPLTKSASAAIAVMLMLAGHARGWPLPAGGSKSVAEALAAHLRALGGEIQTGYLVRSLSELPPSRLVFLDVTPRQFAQIAGERLAESQKKEFLGFRYGMGVFKMDFALSAPVPWRASECAQAGTVHLGGSLEEIAVSEQEVADGRHGERPFVLTAQPSLFDPSRAPAGQHVLWAYCHVPHASTRDMSGAVERQIERFAPGFSKVVLARSFRNTRALEDYNPNCVGGDISGGATDFVRLALRPRVGLSPYATPLQGVYLCSASTPPGPGVHGMCGHLAALAALG
jgi:phytoene dehydrogenase-like protein